MDLFKVEETKKKEKDIADNKLKAKTENAKEDKDFTDFFKLLNQRKKTDKADDKLA